MARSTSSATRHRLVEPKVAESIFPQDAEDRGRHRVYFTDSVCCEKDGVPQIPDRAQYRVDPLWRNGAQ
jgi:hypothetical protein